jgi:hypothetical protein
MEEKQVWISYWDKKYLDYQFPEQENIPYFQLSIGDFLKGVHSDKQPVTAISQSKDFCELASDVLLCLESPNSSNVPYHINFSEDASTILREKGKSVLEGIVKLHNKLVAFNMASEVLYL